MSGFSGGFALVIGVSGYPCLPRLPLAVLNDVVDIARVLWDPQICGYRPDRVRLLVEAEATAEGIRGGIKWLAESCGSGDTAILYFSGHGWQGTGNSKREWYLAAYDASTDACHDGMLPGSELTELLSKIKAGRLAIVLDCCYAAGTAALKGGDMEELRPGLKQEDYERLAQGRGRVILASSRSDEKSLVLEGDRNSLMTDCLLRGLTGAAGNESEVRALDLFRYVAKEVPARSDHRQHPVLKCTLEDDFPLALRRCLATPNGPEESARLAAEPAASTSISAGRDIVAIKRSGPVTINNR